MNLDGERVLAFAASYAPRVGGGEKYACRYLESLVDAGATVDVVTTVAGSSGSTVLNGVNVHYVDATRIAGFPSFSLATIRQNIERSRCTIVQTFSPSVHDFAVAAFAYFKGIPLVVVYHADLKDDRGIGFFATRLHNYATLTVARRIVTTNPRIATRLRSRGIAGRKIRAIVPGIDPAFFPNGTGAEITTPLDVLFVGALDEYHEYKRLDLLLEAIATLHRAGETIALTVVGSGSQLDAHRRSAELLGIAGVVSFLGYVDEADLPSLYRGARVLVLPSPTTQEGFGLVCLEAMASGTPVVCSRNAGASSIVESFAACALWDGRDSATLVAAILAARSATAHERGSLSAGMRSYSWSAMGRTISQEIRDMERA